MSIRNLQHLLRPQSVAVIGASDRPGSLGSIVMRNMGASGFKGPVWAVSKRHRTVAGRPAWAHAADLPGVPELAVICTPAPTVPGLIHELGRKGCKAAIVLSAGLHEKDAKGHSLQEAMLAAARPHLLRILGPDCVGLLVPDIGLNASFTHLMPAAGDLAFLSQSSGLTSALLDWAHTRSIGFSNFVSMGDCADVDFGDMLDYLATCRQTRAILMYMESVQSPRKFLSAARAASRNKPVIVVKSGRAGTGLKAASLHSGAPAGDDEVFDAAIRRAGMLRVETMRGLFDAAQTLAHARQPRGERLLVVTNGATAGVLAADAVGLRGRSLPEPDPALIDKLDRFLPASWSRTNPVDILGAAPVERYVQTLNAVLASDQVDAVLFMHAPNAIVSTADIAAACVPLLQGSRKTVVTAWLGGAAVQDAMRQCEAARLPAFDTPEQAVRAFARLAEYRRNQETLLQTPASIPGNWQPDVAQARELLAAASAAGRSTLTELEAKDVLSAYGIPVVESLLARTVDAAVAAAADIGFPVVLKIVAPGVTHKSEVGGVALDLDTADAVRAAAEGMRQRLRDLRPDAVLGGFSVQAMVRRPQAHELVISVATDPVFGPVIAFGQGGTAADIVRDRAVTLPPLNTVLARDLVSRTRVSKLLAGYSDHAAIDFEALYLVLLKVSQMVCDLAEVAEIDINPLLADADGVVALDARIRLAAHPGRRARERLAIRPYPAELESRVTAGGGEVFLRPIRPEDEPALRAFFESVPEEDLRMRFFARRGEFSHAELARYSQIDYDREMTFVAFDSADVPQARILGYVVGLSDPDNVQAEFAVQVHPDAKGRGMGRLLMNTLIGYLRGNGTQTLTGVALSANQPMLELARRVGMKLEGHGLETQMTLELNPAPPPHHAGKRERRASKG
jgi:acetyltransferase